MRLPEEFINYTQALMGERLFGRLMTGLAEAPLTSIRLHPKKSMGFKVDEEWSPEPISWCDGGYYLSGRPHFTFDPLLHAGAYYVQDAASMFIDRVIRQYVQSPVLMLDLCAAPGGKSTAALSALPEGSLLFANEPMGARAQILAENLIKYGHPDVVVTNNYPADYHRAKLSFDVILTDVPCSGEGMFRKDEGAITEWSVQNVEKCSRLQRDIMATAWSCLRTGGILIYSTCTLNDKENEKNIIWADEELGATPIPVDIQPDWCITGPLGDTTEFPAYRFIPGVSRGEGLFMAVLRKGNAPISLSPFVENRKVKNKVLQKHKNPNDKTIAKAIEQWLQSPDSFQIIERNEHLWAIPKRWHSIYESSQLLRILHAGVDIAVKKGHDLIPQHALGLSTQLPPDAFHKVEVDEKEAVAYLSKTAVNLSTDIPKGYILLTHRGLPLGFVKHLGNRSNNLYPQEWKIRSSHYPEHMKEILKKI